MAPAADSGGPLGSGGASATNPAAPILTAGMMLRYTLALSAEADAVDSAVRAVLADNVRTPDLYTGSETLVGTAEMGRRIAEKI